MFLWPRAVHFLIQDVRDPFNNSPFPLEYPLPLTFPTFFS